MDEQATTFKDKNENNSCYHYLRINDKLYIYYRNQSKTVHRKAILNYEKSLSREVKTYPKNFLICKKEVILISNNTRSKGG